MQARIERVSIRPWILNGSELETTLWMLLKKLQFSLAPTHLQSFQQFSPCLRASDWIAPDMHTFSWIDAIGNVCPQPECHLHLEWELLLHLAQSMQEAKGWTGTPNFPTKACGAGASRLWWTLCNDRQQSRKTECKTRRHGPVDCWKRILYCFSRQLYHARRIIHLLTKIQCSHHQAIPQIRRCRWCFAVAGLTKLGGFL